MRIVGVMGGRWTVEKGHTAIFILFDHTNGN